MIYVSIRKGLLKLATDVTFISFLVFSIALLHKILAFVSGSASVCVNRAILCRKTYVLPQKLKYPHAKFELNQCSGLAVRRRKIDRQSNFRI